MTTINKDTVVQFNYTLTNAEGEILDQSRDQPLVYLHGHHNIIPGLEKQMMGKSAGDTFKVTIALKMLMANMFKKQYKKYHEPIFRVWITLKWACNFNHKRMMVM